MKNLKIKHVRLPEKSHRKGKTRYNVKFEEIILWPVTNGLSVAGYEVGDFDYVMTGIDENTPIEEAVAELISKLETEPERKRTHSKALIEVLKTAKIGKILF